MNSNSKEVYDKTSGILAAIENCGCSHCIALLKTGLGNHPNTNRTDDADTTNPEYKSGVSYTDG